MEVQKKNPRLYFPAFQTRLERLPSLSMNLAGMTYGPPASPLRKADALVELGKNVGKSLHLPR